MHAGQRWRTDGRATAGQGGNLKPQLGRLMSKLLFRAVLLYKSFSGNLKYMVLVTF